MKNYYESEWVPLDELSKIQDRLMGKIKEDEVILADPNVDDSLYVIQDNLAKNKEKLKLVEMASMKKMQDAYC